jgi:hypothetical protein
MFKGKKLWILLGVGAAAYYIWYMKMKNDKAKKAALATTPGSATNFTGSYFNANGTPNVNASGMPKVNMAGGKKY